MGRAIGALFVIGAVVVFGFDLYAFLDGGVWRLNTLGELWFQLDAGSLNLIQAVIERYVWPPLWDPGLLTVLFQPAAAILGAIGLILLVLFRKRRN